MQTKVVGPFGDRLPTTAPGVRASVIVPFWNEAGNLPHLSAALRAALNEQDRTWEVLLVNDGSTDASVEEARAISEADDRFRLISLKKHQGKSAALAAGRDLARGQSIVTIDADLQDPPEMIPVFLDKLDEGVDVVAAVRHQRKESVHRRAATAVFNRTIKWVTGVPLQDMNAGLKAYRRSFIDTIHLSRGMHRFIPVLAHGQGFSVAEVPVQHRERFAGQTKYGLWRYLETVACLGTVMLLRSGAAAALRRLIRLGALLVVIGIGLLIFGWLAGSVAALIGGAIACLLGSQFIIGRLIAEILFQFSSTAKVAPPPYELETPPPASQAAAS